MGNYGPDKDGVDGRLGPLTKKAFKKEFEKNPNFKSKYGHLMGEYESDPEFYSSERPNDTSEYSDSEYGSNNVIFVAGITTTKSHSEQVSMLKNGVGGEKNVQDFKWGDWNKAIEAIKKNPKSKVVLYSMGGKNADKIANAVSQYGGSLKNLYVIESPKSFSGVERAINMGVPPSNVLAGPSPGRGLGTYGGKTSLNTKKNGVPYGNHFQALTNFTREKIGV